MVVGLTGACADGAAPAANTQAQGAQSLSCVANSTRVCPCLGGGMGTQACLPTGNGYSACQGCPPPPVQMPPTTIEPMTMMMAMEPAMPMDMPDATIAMPVEPDAGMDMDMMDEDDVMAMPGMEGTSCGVGLPALCALETEKCCVRTLMTDTCIGVDEACDCSIRGCSVLEAHCDGPEDCPDGQQCCGTLGGDSYTQFRCATSCDYRNTQRIACHQDESECPAGNVCANSQLLTNLQVCIDPATIQQ